MREEGFKQPGAPSVDTRHPAARVHEWVSWEAENSLVANTWEGLSQQVCLLLSI